MSGSHLAQERGKQQNGKGVQGRTHETGVDKVNERKKIVEADLEQLTPREAIRYSHFRLHFLPDVTHSRLYGTKIISNLTSTLLVNISPEESRP